jgi:hypothetical protein
MVVFLQSPENGLCNPFMVRPFTRVRRDVNLARCFVGERAILLLIRRAVPTCGSIRLAGPLDAVYGWAG